MRINPVNLNQAKQKQQVSFGMSAVNLEYDVKSLIKTVPDANRVLEMINKVANDGKDFKINIANKYRQGNKSKLEATVNDSSDSFLCSVEHDEEKNVLNTPAVELLSELLEKKLYPTIDEELEKKNALNTLNRGLDEISGKNTKPEPPQLEEEKGLLSKIWKFLNKDLFGNTYWISD